MRTHTGTLCGTSCTTIIFAFHRSHVHMELPPVPVRDQYSPSFDPVDISCGHEYEDVTEMASSEFYKGIGPQQQQATEYSQCPAYVCTTTTVDKRQRGP